MSYKTVLVPLDADPRCAVRVALAAGLAANHGSRLVGLASTGRPDIVVSLNSAVPDALEWIQLSATFLRQRAEAALHAFELQVRAIGTVSFEGSVVEEESLEATVRLGRCCDLVVVGQSDPATNLEGTARDFPQQVVLHTGVPVLVVPFAGAFAVPGRRVIVAWKDTREAARALRDALPVLRAADQVVLAQIGEEGAEAQADADTLRDAQRWLAGHGIAATARSAPQAAGVGAALLALASELSCDLIVMGAYGHSRLREWVLGGATRHILGHMTVPVLMSH